SLMTWSCGAAAHNGFETHHFLFSGLKRENVRDTICNHGDLIPALVAPSTFRRKTAAVPAWNPREPLAKFALGLRRCRIADRMRTRCETRKLLALEVGRALVEESVHALAEVLAHVGLEYEVFAFIARQRTANAAHRFLGDFERNRCMAR